MRQHDQYYTSVNGLLLSVYKHRSLLLSLILRDVKSRYRDSVLGFAWTFINPLLMLSVYTFVFSYVFKANTSTGSGSKTEFALILYSGLMVFNLFAECINRASSLVVSNVSYVKKVIFPLEILPIVNLGSVLFHGMINFVVWVIFYSIFFGQPKLTTILYPLIILPLVMISLGGTWILASLGVFLRDISQIIGMAMQLLMFLSPIFYTVSMLPEVIRPYMAMNPIAQTIDQVRAILISGVMPDLKTWVVYFMISLLVAWMGFFWFQKTRKGFADVL
jgi:lipopolysaccharide transport system permease protein